MLNYGNNRSKWNKNETNIETCTCSIHVFLYLRWWLWWCDNIIPLLFISSVCDQIFFGYNFQEDNIHVCGETRIVGTVRVGWNYNTLKLVVVAVAVHVLSFFWGVLFGMDECAAWKTKGIKYYVISLVYYYIVHNLNDWHRIHWSIVKTTDSTGVGKRMQLTQQTWLSLPRLCPSVDASLVSQAKKGKVPAIRQQWKEINIIKCSL